MLMNKKGTIVILIVGSILFLGSYKNNLNKVVAEAVDQNKPILCDERKIHSFFDNLSIGGPTKEDAISACYSKVADKSSNSSICQMIRVPSYKDLCYSDYAYSHNEYEICGKLRFTATCYRNFAERNGDINICENIENISAKEVECYSAMAGLLRDESVCANKVHDIKNKNSCYRDVASSKKDISICEEITENVVKKDCRDNISEYLERVSQ